MISYNFSTQIYIESTPEEIAIILCCVKNFKNQIDMANKVDQTLSPVSRAGFVVYYVKQVMN